MVVLGVGLCLVNAVNNGVVAVQTRMMQKLSFALILFYYSLVALASTSLVYLAIALFKSANESSSLGRLFAYRWHVEGKWILGTVLCNMSALFARTIAT